MTNEELESRFARLVKTERKIALEVLRLIGEAERRRHYLARGFGSLFDWLTRGHGYSHPAAQRRIQAARLLRDVPELETELEAGGQTLSSLAQAQSVFAREEARTKTRIAGSVKMEALRAIRGKTFREAEQILCGLYPLARKKESLRAINGEDSRLSLNLSRESVEHLHRARELLAHVVPSGSWSEIVAYLLQEFIKRRTRRNATSDSAAHCGKPAACQFRDEKTGRVCGSRYQLQRDHIIPRALGGTDAPENIRILCRKHNIYEAERSFGKDFMDRFRH